MEQLDVLKKLVKEAVEGDEFGFKPDITPNEIKAIKWAIEQIESKK